MSKHKFKYNWELKNTIFTKDKGKVFSCFACGGGSSFGYKLAGFDVIGANDIDPKMKEVYIENHNPKYYFLESITTLAKRKDLPKELYNLDILDGSPPCFEAGTLVMTDQGLCEIENLSIGQKVLTHSNRFMPITRTYIKESNSHYLLKIQGMLSTRVTGEHPLYVRRMSRRNKTGVRLFSTPKWVDVKDLSTVRNTSNSILEQDYIGIAINQESKLPKWDGVVKSHHIYGRSTKTKNCKELDLGSGDLWYIIGRYIGDGWMRVNNKRNEFIICCAKNELQELSKAFINANLNYCVAEQRTTYRLTVSSKELCAFTSQFGSGAKGKMVTESILNLPIPLLERFLDGYLAADGHFDKRDEKWSYCTVSKKLAIGIQACVFKVYKCPTTISIKDNTKYASIIEGRKVNTTMAYTVQFFKERKKQQHGFYDNGYLWIPYRHKELVVEPLTVYNIAVSEDESYTFNNAICHNCSSFSMAGNREKDWGKEKKFREGQEVQVLDTLFFDFIDLSKELQPKVVIAENVKGLLLGNAKEYVIKIYKAFDEAGYYCQHWLLDASKMGVPQRRERVFFIALRKDLAKPFLYQKDMFTEVPKLEMIFNEKQIPFKEFKEKNNNEYPVSDFYKSLWEKRINGDDSFANINGRERGKKNTCFGTKFLYIDKVCGTLTTKKDCYCLFDEPRYTSDFEAKCIGSYPQDYDFMNLKPAYLIGMSVPPVVMAQISSQIHLQWLQYLK